MKKRWTAEQWREILAKPKGTGCTDAQIATEAGVSVEAGRAPWH